MVEAVLDPVERFSMEEQRRAADFVHCVGSLLGPMSRYDPGVSLLMKGLGGGEVLQPSMLEQLSHG